MTSLSLPRSLSLSLYLSLSLCDHSAASPFSVPPSNDCHWSLTFPSLILSLPLSLLQSFHPRKKMANVYFLIIAIMQMIPSITNTMGFPTVLFPLGIVITVDAVFAILEDLDRHRADDRANATSTTRVGEGGGEEVMWAEIKVGDVVKIMNHEVSFLETSLFSIGFFPGRQSPSPTTLLLLFSSFSLFPLSPALCCSLLFRPSPRLCLQSRTVSCSSFFSFLYFPFVSFPSLDHPC